MLAYEYGTPSAQVVLIQMVGDQDLTSLEKEFGPVSLERSCRIRERGFRRRGGRHPFRGAEILYRPKQNLLHRRLFSGWALCPVGGVSGGSV